jgi:hypothetical protein
MANIGIQQGATGKQIGQVPIASAGEFGELLISELQARFYEQNYRGNLYSGGMQTTSISNATFTTADGLSGTLATAATATPIVGIWNPSTSGVNAVIFQSIVAPVLTAATSTGTGPLVWAGFVGQTASITTGLNPINRKTFVSPGSSQVKNLAGVALTGLQNTGSFLGASGSSTDSTNFSFVGTAAGAMTFTGGHVENVDGGIIVPPGGILALFASTTPVAVSAATSLIWCEVGI